MATLKYYSPKVLSPKDARKTFNPRYLDLDQSITQPQNRDLDYGYREIDELSSTMKIFNISRRICQVGHRDGGVSTLRNTPPNELMGKRCYFPHAKRDVNGRLLSPHNHDTAIGVPHIEEGIYIIVEKQVSIGASDIHKGISSISYTDTDPSNLILGDVYHQVMEGGQYPQEEYDYEVRLPGAGSFTDTGYRGPTYYKGDPDRVYPMSRKAGRDHQAQRSYERVTVEYFIPMEEINKAHDRYLYIEELDICLSTGLNHREVIHPFSKKGKEKYQQQRVQEVQQMKEGLAGLTIVNIDNRNLSSVNNSYYVNLGNTIINIKPVADESMKDGLYFYRNNAEIVTESGDVQASDTCIYMTHGEALAHKRLDLPSVYRTYQEAFALGDITERRKEELRIKEADYQAKILKAKEDYEHAKSEVSQLKADLEKEKLKRDDDYDKRNTERKDYYDDKASHRRDYYDDRASSRKDHYDDKSSSRKDHYDEVSTNRKDSSDLLKFGLTLGGFMMGVMVAFLK